MATRSPSAVLRHAALYKTPREPYLLGGWAGGGDAFSVAANHLESFDEWWDKSAPIEARRMFLLLVALRQEEIDAANAAAYHGDIDGDFDY